MQSLGKIVHRAPAVGAKHGVCMFVLYKLVVTLRDRHAAFFRSDCSFRCTAQFSFLSLGGTTNFAKLRLKISKSPNIGGKRLCARLRIDS